MEQIWEELYNAAKAVQTLEKYQIEFMLGA